MADPLGKNPSCTTYIAVTLRKYEKKRQWAETRQEEGFWSEVRLMTLSILSIGYSSGRRNMAGKDHGETRRWCLYWYHKKSISKISEHFGYTNDVNTRNQKSKCQKRLRKIAYKELNSL